MKKAFLPLLFCFLMTCFFAFESSVLAQTIGEEQKSKTLTEDDLNEIVNNNKTYTQEGEIADYIPELGKANPEDIAISVVDEEGELLEAGDYDKTFTVQSISKLIGLMLAVEDHGEEEVFERMGYFGTSEPFNHYANLETDEQPLNPMMNAGAILTTAMIEGEGDEPYQRILERIRYITNNDEIQINEAVYQSEKSTGDRNRGIFYLLKSNGLIEGDEEKLNNYFRQCSIELSSTDLAKIGYYFAHQCRRFDGDDTYENQDIAELMQAQMMIAGMYDFSGEYAREIGLPSKSGVGGGITVSVPNEMGVGVYSPALDEHGNSVAGYHMLLSLIDLLDLGLFK